eukprot:jgi/Tetstr1/432014/TSEL_021490.t1
MQLEAGARHFCGGSRDGTLSRRPQAQALGSPSDVPQQGAEPPQGVNLGALGEQAVRLGFATSADHGCLNRVVMYTQLSGTYLLMLNCCSPPRLEGHVRDLGLDASEVLRAMMASTLPALPGSPPELLRQLASEYAAAGVPDGDSFLVAVKEAEASQTEQDGTKDSRAAGM